MSTALNQANQAVNRLRSEVKKDFYPEFHLTPPAGWMNDPNGLIYFNGLYHAFYQHHPFDENWGPMHWGHMTSPDLVHWQHQLIALAPDQDYDRDGCFSGCAVDDNGVLTLIYTGHRWLKEVGDDSAIQEVQCIATSEDGIYFTKHGPILQPPKDIMHFRDPKVWKQDERWYLVVGARDLHDTGQILLYSATDLRHWQFERILARASQKQGYMWECPDFFPLQDKFILMFSPQGIQAEGYQFRNQFQSGYLIGNWTPNNPFNVEHDFQELDAGHDFYAPQSFLAADGRRIIFGWMDMWESPMPSKADHWAGSFTLPRELSLGKQGNILIRPIRELTALRQNDIHIPPIQIISQHKTLDCPASSIELQVIFDLKQSTAERYGLELMASEDGKYATRLYIDNQAARLIFDRSQSGKAVTGYRSVPLNSHADSLHLHIFIDRSSVEIFINHGENCITSRIYPLGENHRVNLYAENGSACISSFQGWQLSSIYR
ncbi:invertase [Pragia fontium]|uniref:Sucrose-6-phosphate hydrolase n=1 Tax=Pragia fontium TaxID=82985 RepID=A0ABQ5LHQ2_9GAMM|nr:glycoside hydrolase family 32 protein [Pragia fontium]GKX63121.1 invertase [Pragia fontium]